MFQTLRKTRGQTIIVQYVMIFFLVVAFVTAMTTYIQRTLQARIRGARNYTLISVNRAASDPRVVNLIGNPTLAEYEPYYINQASTRASTVDETRYNIQSLPTGVSGIFQLNQSQQATVSTTSNQAPPAQAN